MVEKNSSFMTEEETTVVVAAATRASFREDLGAAIEIMETKLANLGIALHYPTPKPTDWSQVTTKLRLLPDLIKLAISASIDAGIGSEESVGKPVSSKDALVAGNVIALYHAGRKRFLRINDKKVNFGGGEKRLDKLPMNWGSERFLVVDAGFGCVAFFNPCHRLFLACKGDGSFTASGYPIMHLDERPRAHESFRIKPMDGENNDDIHLYSDIEKKNASFEGCNSFRVIQIHGFQ